MSTYPNLNESEAILSKLKTRDDEFKNLKNQTEKHDHENILNKPKSDNESYKNNLNP